MPDKPTRDDCMGLDERNLNSYLLNTIKKFKKLKFHRIIMLFMMKCIRKCRDLPTGIFPSTPGAAVFNSACIAKQPCPGATNSRASEPKLHIRTLEMGFSYLIEVTYRYFRIQYAVNICSSNVMFGLEDSSASEQVVLISSFDIKSTVAV
ncbi:hypothetical protein Anapl_00104 [Anas platyrhynchos]|uniref:Uncharacterized protein n=1 Tax=Anas platyrhynchos TaxID=8839 RepID=R0LQ25_ANAPL|nr:hypothetical protein Anapl_00104 [Anas platyrhynchos]